MLPDKGVLALLGGLVRVHVLQLLRGDEGDLAAQLGVAARGSGRAARSLVVADSTHDGADGALQEVQIAVVRG